MYLGLDLGTSGLKAVVTRDDAVVAEAHAPLTVARPHPGWAEQDPNSWIAAAEAALTELAAKNALQSVEAIGLSGQMHGATLLDTADQPLVPCILWNDTRAHAEAAALDALAPFRDLTGNIVFPGFTAPKLVWLKNNDPHTFAKVAKILLPKDFLRLWLTGEHVGEMSDAAGTSWLDVRKRDWSDTLLEATDLSRDHMPRLVEGSDISGTLRKDLAQRFGLAEVPVAGGGGDNAASAVGVGITRPGEAFLSLGTSGVLFAACPTYSPDAATAVHTFCHALPETWHQMGVILAATDALEWYARLTGQSAADLTGALGDLQAPGRTTFLPYLGGERTPHNDAQIRGSLTGLEHATDTAAGTRAILEGVAFAFRDSRDALASTGTEISRILAIGGGSRSAYWLKCLATVLDTPLDVPVAGDFGGAFGAARLAAMAHTGDITAASPQIDRQIDPDPTLTEAYDAAYARFRAMYPALKDLS